MISEAKLLRKQGFPQPWTYRYQLLGMIGAGGMGAVYRALDRLTGHDVALKAIMVSSGDWLFASTQEAGVDPEVALAREFRTLATIQHPNIVNVLDYGFTDDGQPFFTMALLDDAQSITEAARNATAETKLMFLIQLIQGVTYLHQRGIIHRDLKPANVLVVNDTVKIVDFGLSAAPQETAQTAGTLAYMAPELIEGSPATQASDLYAIGIIACEIFNGSHPFPTKDYSRLIDAILAGDPALPFAATGTDPRLQAIITRLTRRMPSKRTVALPDLFAVYEEAAGRPYRYLTVSSRDSFLQSARFIGREHEMSTFREMLGRLAAGQAENWLVAGESGIGKSRLLDEIRSLALVQGIFVLRGQARSENNRLYEVWREPLANMVIRGTVTDPEASTLRPYLPQISRVLGRPVDMPPLLSPQSLQARLFEVVRGLLDRIDQPVLILLDDLQWITKESIALLNFLLNELKGKPIAFIGSFRDDEAPGLPEKLPGPKVLKLERLQRTEIALLTESMLGVNGRDPNVVNLVTQETEGNVFFIVEVMRALAEMSGGLTGIGTRTLPASLLTGGVREVVERRLARVPQLSRSLLNVAAVSGRALDLNLLDRFRPPELMMQNWLQECADAAILERTSETWRFAHDKLREALVGALSPAEKALLNQQIAEAIEVLYPDDPSLYVALYNHWRHSENQYRTAYYAARAGEQLVAEFAFEDAARCLRRAIELAPTVGTPPSDQAELHRLLGVTCRQFPERLAEYNKALELIHWPVPPLEPRRAIPLVVAAILRQVLIHRVVPQSWIRAREGNEAMHQAARLYQEISGEFWNDRRYIATGAVCVMGALNLAERAGLQTPTLARAYAGAAAGTGAVLGWHRLSAFYARRAATIAEATGDQPTLAYVLNAVSFDAKYTGRWDEAQQILSRAVEIATAIGDRDTLAAAVINLAEMALYRGDLPETITIIERHLEKNQAVGIRQLASAFLTMDLAEALLLTGKVEKAVAIAESMAADATLSVAQRLSAAAILIEANLRAGGNERALSLLEEFYALGTEQQSGLDLLAEPALRLCALYPSPENTEHLLTIAGLGLQVLRRRTIGILVKRPIWYRLRGEMAWIEGQPRRAFRLWTRGLTLAGRLGARLEESRILLVIAMHRPAGHPARVAELKRAAAGLQECGALAFLPQAQALIAEDGEPALSRDNHRVP